jgi:hypothetical protein
MLNKEEAKQLVLARLGERQDARDFFIAEERTIERPFGWVFFLEVPESGPPHDSGTMLRGPIIVNKYVGQIIASSTAYPLERFIEIYEELLAQSQASEGDWCLTLSFPLPWRGFRRRRLTKKAKEAGFYEIR